MLFLQLLNLHPLMMTVSKDSQRRSFFLFSPFSTILVTFFAPHGSALDGTKCPNLPSFGEGSHCPAGSKASGPGGRVTQSFSSSKMIFCQKIRPTFMTIVKNISKLSVRPRVASEHLETKRFLQRSERARTFFRRKQTSHQLEPPAYLKGNQY